MATIGDVANVAGVARSTVSAVLSGKKYVSPEITARVEAAIEDLNYTVNQGARALATSKTMTLGLVVTLQAPEFEPATATYIMAVADAARAQHYSVLLITDSDGVAAISDAIASRRVDGLILMGVVEGDPRVAPILQADFPAVLIGMPHETVPVDAVDLDFAAAGTMLADLVDSAAHKNVAIVTWPDEIFAAERTYATRFLDACEQRAIQRGFEVSVLRPPLGAAATIGFLMDVLTGAGRPSALLVHNDAAIAMLPVVTARLGIEVPQGLGVASVHTDGLREQYAIPYTAAGSRAQTVSEIAVQMVLERIANPDIPVRRELIAPVITDRGSV